MLNDIDETIIASGQPDVVFAKTKTASICCETIHAFNQLPEVHEILTDDTHVEMIADNISGCLSCLTGYGLDNELTVDEVQYLTNTVLWVSLRYVRATSMNYNWELLKQCVCSAGFHKKFAKALMRIVAERENKVVTFFDYALVIVMQDKAARDIVTRVFRANEVSSYLNSIDDMVAVFTEDYSLNDDPVKVGDALTFGGMNFVANKVGKPIKQQKPDQKNFAFIHRAKAVVKGWFKKKEKITTGSDSTTANKSEPVVRTMKEQRAHMQAQEAAAAAKSDTATSDLIDSIMKEHAGVVSVYKNSDRQVSKERHVKQKS